MSHAVYDEEGALLPIVDHKEPAHNHNDGTYVDDQPPPELEAGELDHMEPYDANMLEEPAMQVQQNAGIDVDGSAYPVEHLMEEPQIHDQYVENGELIGLEDNTGDVYEEEIHEEPEAIPPPPDDPPEEDEAYEEEEEEEVHDVEAPLLMDDTAAPPMMSAPPVEPYRQSTSPEPAVVEEATVFHRQRLPSDPEVEPQHDSDKEPDKMMQAPPQHHPNFMDETHPMEVERGHGMSPRYGGEIEVAPTAEAEEMRTDASMEDDHRHPNHDDEESDEEDEEDEHKSGHGDDKETGVLISPGDEGKKPKSSEDNCCFSCLHCLSRIPAPTLTAWIFLFFTIGAFGGGIMVGVMRILKLLNLYDEETTEFIIQMNMFVCIGVILGMIFIGAFFLFVAFLSTGRVSRRVFNSGAKNICARVLNGFIIIFMLLLQFIWILLTCISAIPVAILLLWRILNDYYDISCIDLKDYGITMSDGKEYCGAKREALVMDSFDSLICFAIAMLGALLTSICLTFFLMYAGANFAHLKETKRYKWTAAKEFKNDIRTTSQDSMHDTTKM